jgi:hypothetical protein
MNLPKKSLIIGHEKKGRKAASDNDDEIEPEVLADERDDSDDDEVGTLAIGLLYRLLMAINRDGLKECH